MTHRADAAGQSPGPHAPLGRLRGTLSGGDWGRLTLMFVSILAVNALGWLIYLAVVLPQHIDYRGYGGTRGLGIGLGVAVTAWFLGFRHAFDADHISCIDNTTRKLMADGKRPLATGYVNGHEWLERQADRDGLRYFALANGFAACDEPSRLQAIADRLGPDHIQAFFERWMRVIPTPLTTADRKAGFWWELSMRQVETSTTLVFDDPRRARAFFEALVQDNVGIGRPGEVAMVFS